MTLKIKPGNLVDDLEFQEFCLMISSRGEGAVAFHVDMEETSEMSLSKFNALIKLYVSLKRSGRTLQYANLHESVQKFVDKTNFHHVFGH